jgi:hypothetical protein
MTLLKAGFTCGGTALSAADRVTARGGASMPHQRVHASDEPCAAIALLTACRAASLSIGFDGRAIVEGESTVSPDTA